MKGENERSDGEKEIDESGVGDESVQSGAEFSRDGPFLPRIAGDGDVDCLDGADFAESVIAEPEVQRERCVADALRGEADGEFIADAEGCAVV